MAIKKVFEDASGNELMVYIDEHGQICVEVGALHDPDANGYYSGCIAMDDEDVPVLIEEITKLLNQVKR